MSEGEEGGEYPEGLASKASSLVDSLRESDKLNVNQL